jgi:hypothetical protein
MSELKKIVIPKTKATRLLALLNEVTYRRRVFAEVGKQLADAKRAAEAEFFARMEEEGVPKNVSTIEIDDTAGEIRWMLAPEPVQKAEPVVHLEPETPEIPPVKPHKLPKKVRKG